MMKKISLNQNGMTMIEVAISTGLVAMLAVMLSSAQLIVAKSQIKMVDKLEDSTDRAVAEKVIFKDFTGMDPSYNNLRLTDDAGRNFYDFYPDVPAVELGVVKRGITMSMSQLPSKEFIIMTQDAALGPMLVYDPVAAYTMGPTPTSWNASASLTWAGLNNAAWIVSKRANFWVNNTLLMMDSPAKVRPLSGNNVNMQVTPRSSTFVGIVTGASGSSPGGSLNKAPVNLVNNLNYTHPETGADIANPDVFLRTVPSVGGGQPLVRIRAVRFIKYYLTAAAVTKPDCISSTGSNFNHGNLVKSVYENGNYVSPPVILATNVCSFEVYRNSVVNKMVNFRIVQVTNKFNTK